VTEYVSNIVRTYRSVPPTKADPLTLLGALLERLREYDRAEESYLRALAIDTEHSDALLRMANLLADVRGDTKGSITYYERSLNASNNDYNDADIPLKIARRRMLETYRCYATFRHRVLGKLKMQTTKWRAYMESTCSFDIDIFLFF
jgi:tetratricopeptide (TPR) repeat protein